MSKHPECYLNLQPGALLSVFHGRAVKLMPPEPLDPIITAQNAYFAWQALYPLYIPDFIVVGDPHLSYFINKTLFS